MLRQVLCDRDELVTDARAHPGQPREQVVEAAVKAVGQAAEALLVEVVGDGDGFNCGNVSAGQCFRAQPRRNRAHAEPDHGDQVVRCADHPGKLAGDRLPSLARANPYLRADPAAVLGVLHDVRAPESSVIQREQGCPAGSGHR